VLNTYRKRVADRMDENETFGDFIHRQAVSSYSSSQPEGTTINIVKPHKIEGNGKTITAIEASTMLANYVDALAMGNVMVSLLEREHPEALMLTIGMSGFPEQKMAIYETKKVASFLKKFGVEVHSASVTPDDAAGNTFSSEVNIVSLLFPGSQYEK